MPNNEYVPSKEEFPQLKYPERKKIGMLRRRREYLLRFTGSNAQYPGRDWDLEELSSLDWALKLIKGLIEATPDLHSHLGYGSTVAGRDVPEPVAPIPAHERGSAARSGSSVGDGPREGVDGPRAVQESLLSHCPKCGMTKAENFFSERGEDYNCEDKWHDS